MGERQDTGGLSTVLRLLGASGRPDGDSSETDLFESATAQLPLPSKVERTGKAGRPKGVPNRSTAEWAAYILSRHKSPLTALAELYSRPTGELVDQLQEMADKHKKWVSTGEGGRWERATISPLDVLKMQRDAAVAMLPYLHKRQPVAIEVEEKQRGIVVLGELMATDLVADDDLALPLAPIVANQGVSEALPAQSETQQSDANSLRSNFNGMTADDV
jgi:hypothetical protein